MPGGIDGTGKRRRVTMDVRSRGDQCSTPSPHGGEGWGEGVTVNRRAVTPHPDRHSASKTRVNALMAIRPLPMGEVKRKLLHLHHLFRLRADARDGLDFERRAAGFLRDLAVLLDDEAERGRVLLQPGEQLRRHAPVGALRAVFIDDVEEHEFVLGVGSRFFRHRHRSYSIVLFVIPGRAEGAGPESRGFMCNSGFRARPLARAPRNDEFGSRITKKKNPAQARGSSIFRALGRLKIVGGRFAVLAVGDDIERELLALVEIAHAGALDRRDVNEHIRPAAVLHDEAETFLGVEELNGTCGHSGLLLKTHMCVYAPCEPFVWASYPDSACSWEKPLGAQLQGRRNRNVAYIGNFRLFGNRAPKPRGGTALITFPAPAESARALRDAFHHPHVALAIAGAERFERLLVRGRVVTGERLIEAVELDQHHALVHAGFVGLGRLVAD